MPIEEYTISSMTLSSGITNNDLMELATPDQSSETGYSSVSATIVMIATKMLKGILFSSDLNTEDKTIIGAINEVLEGGGGGSASILYGTTAPSSSQGEDGNLYVQYTEGAGGADDTVDGLFVKLDGTWCQISTGGSGGSGGHTILDDSGTALTQRSSMQFKGAYSEDNSTDSITEVNVVRNMTKAEFDQLSADEKVGIINITDITSGSDDRFQPVIYSTEEREIGVWTDGKPLYEKTIAKSQSLAFSNQTVVEDLTSLNIDTFVGFSSSSFEADGNTILGDAAVYMLYDENAKSLKGMQRYSERVIAGFLITKFRYTKTTDTAGSGQWTPQGVPAVHYSTDEQVVGTWIDGSTLYEKVIHSTTTPTGGAWNGVSLGVINVISYEAYFVRTTGAVDALYESYDSGLIGHIRPDTTGVKFEYKVPAAYVTNFQEVDVVIRYTKSST